VVPTREVPFDLELQAAGWREAGVDNLIEAMEAVYREGEAARGRAAGAAEAMRRCQWHKSVRTLLHVVDRGVS
jgi:hypothetical protein